MTCTISHIWEFDPAFAHCWDGAKRKSTEKFKISSQNCEFSKIPKGFLFLSRIPKNIFWVSKLNYHDLRICFSRIRIFGGSGFSPPAPPSAPWDSMGCGGMELPRPSGRAGWAIDALVQWVRISVPMCRNHFRTPTASGELPRPPNAS